MRLLILSFYFPPDLSAGSFRVQAVVQALMEASPDVTIDVVTTTPNRYNSFTQEVLNWEDRGRLTVRRIDLPLHKSGVFDQAWSFLTFAREARRVTRRERYDLIFVTSSRLMTATLGAHLSKRLKAPLYCDLRDIFVDTINDVFPRLKPILAIFSQLERLTISRSHAVNLVSKGFEPYFSSRYPAKRFTFFTNGIDEDFIDLPTVSSGTKVGEPLVALYAGNIGEGQGLHVILPGLARALRERVRFRVLGDGGRRQALVEAVNKQGIDNVEVVNPVKRDELVREYQDADLLFLHLNDYAAFRKVLPSKLFEYAATGKPIWAGLAGYAAEFARTEVDNVALFPPCNVEEALRAFDALQIKRTDRSGFIARFDRREITRRFAQDILSAARSGEY